MKARFQPDTEARVPAEPSLIDPEAYDASEQQFAASLEETGARFVIQADASTGHPAGIEPSAPRPEIGDHGMSSRPGTESPIRLDLSPLGASPLEASTMKPSQVDLSQPDLAPASSDRAEASAEESPESGLQAPSHPVAS